MLRQFHHNHAAKLVGGGVNLTTICRRLRRQLQTTLPYAEVVITRIPSRGAGNDSASASRMTFQAATLSENPSQDRQP
ncbi:hypothetical protein [Deinococcus aerophilus]|uniref:hypothetical protein n=1 Tax=Deinococcus aerophilus TaxID=522488 RepID=UPI0016667C4F|nr:hypothetical protein [Deinococcus aerophilus]